MSHPPCHSGLVVWGEYGGELRNAIIALKHHTHDELAEPLAQRLCDRILAEHWDPSPEFVTAVPSHPLYRLRRGYSASELVATAIARRLCLPSCQALSRRDLGRQARRSRAQRTAMAGKAFGRRRAARKLNGRSVLLIDDVTTTGTTMHRASRSLLQAGAGSVYCAALARTPDSRRMQ
ncbi:MAG: ComF family protein [bacterium]|nr:ComF family protein [bacterium]